jgi:response regulator NasT
MPAAATPLHVLVAASDEQTRALLSAAITSAGHVVVAQAATGADAVARAFALAPHVALLDLHLPEGSGPEAAALIARMEPAPGVVLLAADPEDAALGETDVGATGATAVLATAAPRALLEATLLLAAAWARELAAARADAAQARRQLEERKLIERAKGILMRRTGSTEAEAYRILQRSSQDRATPMVTLARAVLDSEPGAAVRR